MIADLPGVLAIAIAAAGAIDDVRRRKLTNRVCAALAIAAATSLGLQLGLPELGWAVLHSILALLIGMALFGFGMIGAGDAKFYAAAALGTPLGNWAVLLGWTSVAGLLVLAVMFCKYRLAEGKSRLPTVPFGLAIFAGFTASVLVRHGDAGFVM